MPLAELKDNLLKGARWDLPLVVKTIEQPPVAIGGRVKVIDIFCGKFDTFSSRACVFFCQGRSPEGTGRKARWRNPDSATLPLRRQVRAPDGKRGVPIPT